VKQGRHSLFFLHAPASAILDWEAVGKSSLSGRTFDAVLAADVIYGLIAQSLYSSPMDMSVELVVAQNFAF
jgi:hypothetical protein